VTTCAHEQRSSTHATIMQQSVRPTKCPTASTFRSRLFVRCCVRITPHNRGVWPSVLCPTFSVRKGCGAVWHGSMARQQILHLLHAQPAQQGRAQRQRPLFNHAAGSIQHLGSKCTHNCGAFSSLPHVTPMLRTRAPCSPNLSNGTRAALKHTPSAAACGRVRN